MTNPRIAKLALEDGTVLTGRAFGADGEVFGEVVFNTSMTGYQEILTDPSYTGQIVTMTYPHIGNYGVNATDVESAGLSLRGFIVKEACDEPSSHRSEQSLDAYLKAAGVIGLEGIDTRALVRRLRVQGAMTGVLSTQDLDDASLVRKAQSSPDLVGIDYVKEVAAKETSQWDTGLSEYTLDVYSPTAFGRQRREPAGNQPHVVAVDYGMKWNIPRHLKQMGCRVTVVPGTIDADTLFKLNPDGVFLSNGPGDPRPLDYAVGCIRDLLGQKPIFGICLGSQLLGLALGGEIYKLKFGHRGANQPVLNKATGCVEITTQNHGFAVNADSLPDGAEVTHINLNDNTVEGIRDAGRGAFAVQYHPEASAGPHDSHYLFGEFFDAVQAAGVQ